MPILVMSFGDRFCMSLKGGTGGGGWVHPQGANSMVASGLSYRKTLVGTEWFISVLVGINGLSNKPFHLAGPPFPGFRAHFQLYQVGSS